MRGSAALLLLVACASEPSPPHREGVDCEAAYAGAVALDDPAAPTAAAALREDALALAGTWVVPLDCADAPGVEQLELTLALASELVAPSEDDLGGPIDVVAASCGLARGELRISVPAVRFESANTGEAALIELDDVSAPLLMRAETDWRHASFELRVPLAVASLEIPSTSWHPQSASVLLYATVTGDGALNGAYGFGLEYTMASEPDSIGTGGASCYLLEWRRQD